MPSISPGIGVPKEKPLPEYLSVLKRSDCREPGATGECGSNEIKTNTIRLPDVESSMLAQVQKRNKFS
jgi:hypothetical protein